MRENTEQDWKEDHGNEFADFKFHKIGTPTIDAQPENRYATPWNRKDTSRNFEALNSKNNKKLNKFRITKIRKKVIPTSQ